MVVTLQLDDYTGLLASTPEIECRGVVKPTDIYGLVEKLSSEVDALLEKASRDPEVWADSKAKLDQLVGDVVYKQTGRRPMIMVVVADAI